MTDLHKAIRTIHTNVMVVRGSTQEDIVATDFDGNTVTIDWTQVNAWTDPEQYKIDRQYPDIGDQLDMLWHAIDAGSLDSSCDFYTTIKQVKDDNPKPE